MDRRRTWRLIFAAATVGLVLRLGFGLVYWTGKPLTHDELEYLSLAESLSSGRGFTYSGQENPGTGQLFSRAPGYPWFLSILRADAHTGAAPTTVKVVQAMLGALSVILIGWIANRAAGDAASVIAGWIAAVYPPLVWISSYVFSEALYLPVGLTIVALLETAGSKLATRGLAPVAHAQLVRTISAGLVAGAASLVRPGTLLFLPMAAMWFTRRRQSRLALAFLIGAVLTIAPWTLRTSRQYGRFILIASEGGVTFWTGNHPLARGEGDLAANPDLKRAEVAFRSGHPGLSAEELEPLYYQDALKHIREHPGRWIGLIARKAFYTVVPIGPSYTLHSTRYLLATVVPYALLAPLAIAGWLVISRYGRPPEALYLLAASVVLTGLIFFPQERFRLPVIDPLVIIGAAAAIGGANRQRP